MKAATIIIMIVVRGKFVDIVVMGKERDEGVLIRVYVPPRMRLYDGSLLAID
jgi:hypothetical protein